MSRFDKLHMFVRGSGNYLFDSIGHRAFDAVSSIWTMVHGHCHPVIVERIAMQARRLDHATLLGAYNDVADELSERLALLSGFDWAFFASDGASAVEAALKMAIQYWQNVGQPERTRFVKLVDSYHGDTIGAMSVSDIGLFKERFHAVTFESATYAGAPMFDEPDLAAIIVEPTVQAAVGMQIVPDVLYEPLRNRSTLLIVDEIATGFGRTGPMFASGALSLDADILCLGKSLTGGTLALSATMVRDRVYEAFLGDLAEHKHLFHGHSYAGNPIACAAALASLDVFESEQTLPHAAHLVHHLEGDLAAVRTHPSIRDVRQRGLMCAVELEPTAIDARGAPTPAWHVADSLYERGYFTRPLGNAIQLVPPLSSSTEELDGFCEALVDVLRA